ncbi:MAG: ABC transporter permease [Promethearchaeota archaeon]|nr:MAG: ABC transporter permease [Candidatus Lokiarchaeota archaeon]
MSMIKYIFRRILAAIPVLFGILTLTFILSRFMPGDPVLATLPERFNTEQYAAAYNALGLNKPIWDQYFIYLFDLFRGNWGQTYSLGRGKDVWIVILSRFPRTFDIAIISIIIASIIGLKTGVIAAKHRNKTRDTLFRGFALIGVSIPVFWLGLILQYIFGYQLGLLPATGYKTSGIGDPPLITTNRFIDSLISGKWYLAFDYIEHLILPVICLTFITIASITRQSRSSMLEVLEQDYIRTARAKGAKERDVVNTHAQKNALIPVATVIGLNFGGLLSGAILTETTFNLNGLGDALLTAIVNTDYWLLNGIVFLITIIFLTINLTLDILYAALDPRIRY